MIIINQSFNISKIYSKITKILYVSNMQICFAKDECVLQHMESEDAYKTLFLCLDWPTVDKLRKKGFSAESFDKFISTKEAAEMDQFIARLRSSWYISEGKDITKFMGISAGAIYEWTFWWTCLVPVCKFLLAATSAIESNSPEKARFDARLPREYLKIYEVLKANARMGKICSLCGLEQTQGGKLDILGGSATKSSASRSDAEKYLFYSISNIVNRIKLQGGRKERKAILSYYPSLDNLLRHWAETAEEHEFGLSLLSRLPSKLQKGHPRLKNMEFFAPGIFRAGLKKEEKERVNTIIKTWKIVSQDEHFRKKFAWKDFDAYPSFEAELGEFFSSVLEKICRKIKEYDTRFISSPPCAVIVPYDVPQFERTIVEIARKYSVPSVTVLHGIPFYYNTYDNGQTDYLVVPSNAMRDIYVSIGKNARSLLPLGSPKFDEYFNKKAREVLAGAKKRILILTYPKVHNTVASEETALEDYIINVLAALRGMDAEISIKLHPSESVEYYSQLVDDKKVRIVKDTSIMEEIENSDIIISTFSTAMLEGLLLGKPIVCFNPSKRVPYPEPCISYVEVLTDYDKLKQRVSEISVGRFKETPKRSIEEFTGPIDGKSSERILKFVEKLCKK